MKKLLTAYVFIGIAGASTGIGVYGILSENSDIFSISVDFGLVITSTLLSVVITLEWLVEKLRT